MSKNNNRTTDKEEYSRDKLLNGSNKSEDAIDMKIINDDNKSDESESEMSHDRDLPRPIIRLPTKSREWIVSLIVLCIILSATLIYSFAKYKMCCLDSSTDQHQRCSQKIEAGNTTKFFARETQTSSSKPDTIVTKSTATAPSVKEAPNLWNSSRLPSNLVPSFYEINLRINVIEKYFIGNCSIYFHCNKPIEVLVVHADTNLVFEDIEKNPPKIYETDKMNKNLKVKSVQFNMLFQYIILELDPRDAFKLNYNYTVKFENFESRITNNLKGIYYSTYNSKNTSKDLVVSQLQPLDARRVFPSFDEPSLKARFSISIENENEYTALSNMDEKEIVALNETWKRTNFETTPIMSTYILAFVVSDFKPVETVGPNQLKIRVWGREDYVNFTSYALDIIPKGFQFFEDYFNIKEVVTKSDHFAAPDFNSGAMENWGLVLYHETALLYDEEKSLLEDEFFVMLVICHEISHSWFGNMATFKWWDNVWLNEAFANTLMYFAMEAIRPEFKVLDTLVVYEVFNVMEKDSVETSHPVSTYVEDPREVQQYFDDISYSKGLSVLRMLQGFIGDVGFQNSLRNHIKKYMFSNCDMEDLWKIIEETTNNTFNISEIMTNWLTQEGYPVVNVTRTIFEKNNTIVFSLKQEYFLLSQTNPVKKNFKWVIPFTYKLKDMPDNITWINLTDKEIIIPKENNVDKWIYGNINYMGYFRVNYDTQNWYRIIEQLKTNHNVFSATERSGLIFDSFALARVGYVDYKIPLELASYLVKETEYAPWKSYFKSITYIDNLLSTSTCYGHFQEYSAKQILPIYNKLGWQDKGDFLERLLRAHVIKYSNYFELDDSVVKAKLKFDEYMNGSKPEKHIVEAVYCTGIKYGSYKMWVQLFNKSIDASPSEQNIIWQALVCNRDTWILKNLLEITLSDKIIRRSEIRRIYGFYSFTPISRSVYFDFIFKNWETILLNFGNDAYIMGSLLETLAVGLADDYSLEKVQKMLSKGAGTATNTPSYVINQIVTNINWVNKYEKQICHHLKNKLF